MAALYWPLSVSQVTEWPASPGRPNHTGTDFGCPVGTPMRATSDGTIVYVGDDGLGGMTVDLVRSDNLLQRFGHLSKYNCRVGQSVKAGDIIALSGNTGMSTGPHLHWELRWDRKWVGGDWVDPRTLHPANFGDFPVKVGKKMLVFITDNPNGSWWVTDGMTKRALKPGENQLLVDLGVAQYAGKPGGVNVIGRQQLAAIPDGDVS
mgnify:CR=1 FL=1